MGATSARFLLVVLAVDFITRSRVWTDRGFFHQDSWTRFSIDPVRCYIAHATVLKPHRTLISPPCAEYLHGQNGGNRTTFIIACCCLYQEGGFAPRTHLMPCLYVPAPRLPGTSPAADGVQQLAPVVPRTTQTRLLARTGYRLCAPLPAGYHGMQDSFCCRSPDRLLVLLEILFTFLQRPTGTCAAFYRRLLVATDDGLQHC